MKAHVLNHLTMPLPLGWKWMRTNDGKFYRPPETQPHPPGLILPPLFSSQSSYLNLELDKTSKPCAPTAERAWCHLNPKFCKAKVTGPKRLTKAAFSQNGSSSKSHFPFTLQLYPDSGENFLLPSSELAVLAVTDSNNKRCWRDRQQDADIK